MKFKVGDKVKVLGQRYGGHRIGTLGTIIGTFGSDCLWIVNDKGETHYNWEGELELISDNKNNMNIKEKFTLAFKSEPEKSFRQAGITNGDDFLTEDGVKIFLGWLLKKHGTEFKTDVVDELLKEDK